MASRAQWSRVVNSDVLVVGIDVAKRRHVAACRLGGRSGTVCRAIDSPGPELRQKRGR